MVSKSEPWYIHTILYVIIIVLAYVLIKVAIIDPQAVMKQEKYWKEESRSRMLNIREAQILWKAHHNRFTDDLDSLLGFVRTDTAVTNLIGQTDTLTGKSKYPFKSLVSGEFAPESLYFAPKSHNYYTLQVDTTTEFDTVVNRTGKIVRIDTLINIGNRYLLEDPDGYGRIGDINSDALVNTPSWEQ